jgi:hypothetical protein
MKAVRSVLEWELEIKVITIYKGYTHAVHTVEQLVEALCYKPEGRRFNSR